MAKRTRTGQPPIDPQRRSTEARPWYVGAIAALAGGVLVLIGATRQYDAGAGQSVSEPQLVSLVTRGGAQRSEPTTASSTQEAGKPKVSVVENAPDYCPT